MAEAHGTGEQAAAADFLVLANRAAGLPDGTPFSLDTMKAAQEGAAQAAVAACVADHADRHTCDEFLSGYWHNGNLTAPFGAHGRDLPHALIQVVTRGCLTADEERRLVRHVWTATEFPELNLATDLWVMLFQKVGYLDDTTGGPQPPPRPSSALTLYRGAIPQRRHGMAWTDSPATAAWFADRFTERGGSPARVYRAVVPPERLLAHFTTRGEDEYVADVRGLRLAVEPTRRKCP